MTLDFRGVPTGQKKNKGVIMVGQTANNSSIIGQSGYDDDFEREDPVSTPNEINNSGISSNLGTPAVTNGGAIK
jgi:hypothetical protein